MSNIDREIKFDKESEELLDRSVSEPSPEFISSLESEMIRLYDKNTSKTNFLSNLFMQLKKNWLIAGAVGLIFIGSIGTGGYLFYNSRYGFDENAVLAEIAKRDNSSLLAPKVMNAESDGDESQRLSSSMDLGMYWRPEGYTYSKTTYTPGPAQDSCSTLNYGTYYGIEDSGYSEEMRSFYDGTRSYYLSIVKTDSGQIVSYYLSTDDGYYEYYGGDYAVYQEYDQALYLPELSRSSDDNLVPEPTVTGSGDDNLVDEPTVKFDEPDDLVDEPTVYFDEPDDLVPEPTVTNGDDNLVPEPTVIDDGTVTEPPKEDGERPEPNEPVEDPDVRPDDPLTIDDYFGGDVKIVKKGKYDGKDAYLLELVSQDPCKEYTYLDKVVSTGDVDSETFAIISRIWVDAETYDYLEESKYFGRVNDSALISVHKYEIEQKDVSWESVKNEFVFLSGVKIEEIETPDSDLTDESNDWVKQNEVSLVIPEISGEISMSNVSAQEVYDEEYAQEFRADRKFYLSGPIGDRLYEMNNSTDNGDYISSKLTYYITEINTKTSNRYFDVSYFEGYSLDRVVEEYTWEGITVKDGKVMVDGKQLNAKVLEYTYSSGSSEPYPGDYVEGSDEALKIEMEESYVEETSYTLIFGFEGYVVVMNYQGESFELFTWDLNNADDWSAYLKAVENSDTAVGIEVDPIAY